MHIINDVQKRVQDFVSENSSTLLTAGGVVGTVATAVLSFRGGMKYQDKYLDNIDKLNAGLDLDDENDRANYVTVDTLPTWTKMQWMTPHILPPVLTGGATIAAIIFSHRMTAQRAAALAAAYGLSQKQFEEYREKVSEKLTGPKKQQIDDELAQERVNRAEGSTQIIVMGDEVICFDEPTGRFFKSSMEKINRAVNSANAEIIHHGYISASYFYSELELEPTTWSDEVGWNSPFEVNITTTITPDGKPCLAVDFKTLPSADYMGPNY
jgi:hypothetical protein